MSYNAFKIANLDEFEATGLVSQELSLNLEGIGLKTVLLTKGNFVSILYEDTFLPIRANGKNPFVLNGYAVFVDPNHDIWLGIVE